MPLPLLAIGGIAAAAGGIGSQMYGASKSGAGQTLKPKDVARSTLRGYAETAPGYYALNDIYGGAYLGQGAQNLEQLLFGTSAATQTGLVPILNKKGKVKRYVTQEITTPASRGYLDLMEAAQPTLARLNTMARTSDLADFERLYPELAGLQEQIGADASSQLALGGKWDPSIEREVSQNVRSNLSARGLGYGPGDVYTEGMTLGRYGQDLRNQRQAYAMDALSRLAGMNSMLMRTDTGQSANLLGGLSGMAYNPVYNPSGTYNPTAANVALSGQAQQYAGNVNQANMYGALGSGMMGLGSSLFDYYQGKKTG